MRPDHQLHVAGERGRQHLSVGQRQASALGAGGEAVGGPDEVRHVGAGRPVIHDVRPVELLDAAGAHHGDPVGERHRLLLVVRHEDRGDAERLDELAELHLHAAAQLGVERVERFVEQQHARLQHDHARDGDALLLAAGELARIALLEASERDAGKRRCDATLDLVLRDAPHPEAVADIACDGEVRKERVALEDDADGSPVHRHRQCVGAVDQNAAAVRPDEAGDTAQKRGLAAAGGAEQRQDFALDRVEGAAVQDRLRAVALDDVPDRDDDRRRHPANSRSKASTVLPRCGATFSQSIEAMAETSAGVDGRYSAAAGGVGTPASVGPK